MKIEDLTRPPLLTVGMVGVVGLAAMAAAGFALGVAVGRDPEAARRRVRAVVGEAARAFEQATLLAAQARERAGDLWAEARAQAVSEVDEQDFAKAAAMAGSGAAAATTGSDGAAPAAQPARRRPEPAPPPAKSSRRATVAKRERGAETTTAALTAKARSKAPRTQAAGSRRRPDANAADADATVQETTSRTNHDTAESRQTARS